MAGERPRRRVRIALVLLLLAALLATLSLITLWWTETFGPGTGGPSSFGPQRIDFYPGTVLYISCTASCPSYLPATQAQPYPSSPSRAELGSLYALAEALPLAGIVLVAVATTAMLVTRREADPPRPRRRWELAVLALTTVLLLAGPVAVAVLQPSALAHDEEGIATGPSPAPGTSFWGSCTQGQGICQAFGETWMTWGPGAGWFLCLASGVAAAVACVALWTAGPRIRGRVTDPAGAADSAPNTSR